MMKVLLPIVFFALQITNSFSQVSSNMAMLDNWDNDTLAAQGSVQYNDIWGYVDCEGTEYAIMGSASKVHFISLADPSNVVEVESFAGGDTTIWRDIKTFQDRAYAVSDNTNEGMMIFDLSGLPNTITKTYHSNEFFGKSHNIYIDEDNGRLYSVGTETQNGGVVVLDLNADPDNPTLLASVNLPADPVSQTGYVHDIFVKDNIAYASHGYLGFFIWDMDDPTNPVLMASKETGGYNHSSWLSEDESFVIYAEEVPIGRPLGVMNLENLDNGFIEIDTTFKFPLLTNDDKNTPHNPFIRGNYLICSYYEDGLQMIDISDPINPVRVAYYDTYPNNQTYTGYKGNWGTYPFLPSGLILASDIETGLYVLELDSSLNLAPTTAPSYPVVSNTLPDSSIACVGEQLNLELPSNFDEYTWFNDSISLGNDNLLTVSETGLYYAEVKNGHCASLTNEAYAFFKPTPNFSSLPVGDVFLCDEETETFTLSNGYDSYTWFQNADSVSNSHMLTVTESGSYQVIASLNGCDGESDIIEVSFSELPTVEITPQGPTEFCEGNFINLMASSNVNDVTWTWSTDSISLGDDNLLAVTESGIYEVTATSIDGCSSTSEIEIIVYEPIVPEITFDGDLLISTAADYYQWYFNGTIINNSNNQNLAVTEIGDYYVGTMDVNGCFSISNTITVETVSNTNIENLTSISIFPNPVNELLQIDLELKKADVLSIEILTIDGKLIFENKVNSQMSETIKINTFDFAQGIYFLKLKNNEGQLTKKFVKI